MLLVIDVGNTHITLGVFEDKELKGTFRMTTGYSRTSDEYGIFICNMLEYRGINKDLVDAAIISSVVPDLMHSLTSGIIKYFHIKPYHIKWDSFTGITVKTANPKALGADRIVDAAAAYEIYGGPVLIADFGTATTYDLVNEKGEFIAEITSPGLEISARALWQQAAKLQRYHNQYAGRTGLRVYRPGGVYCKEGKGRIGTERSEGGGHRRTGKSAGQRDRNH